MLFSSELSWNDVEVDALGVEAFCRIFFKTSLTFYWPSNLHRFVFLTPRCLLYRSFMTCNYDISFFDNVLWPSDYSWASFGLDWSISNSEFALQVLDRVDRDFLFEILLNDFSKRTSSKIDILFLFMNIDLLSAWEMAEIPQFMISRAFSSKK